MAKFNKNIYGDLTEEQQKEEIIKVVPMLQEMMSETELNKLRKDYHNGSKEIPFWKFIFQNVEVIYSK